MRGQRSALAEAGEEFPVVGKRPGAGERIFAQPVHGRILRPHATDRRAQPRVRFDDFAAQQRHDAVFEHAGNTAAFEIDKENRLLKPGHEGTTD